MATKVQGREPKGRRGSEEEEAEEVEDAEVEEDSSSVLNSRPKPRSGKCSGASSAASDSSENRNWLSPKTPAASP